MVHDKLYANSAELLTTKEVAQILSCSLTTVRNLVSSGTIPSIKIGKNRRFVAGTLYEWIQRQCITQKNPLFEDLL